MAETIVTQFVGDTSDLEAKIAALTKDLNVYDKATDTATAGTKALTNELGSASGKFQLVSGAATSTGVAIQKSQQATAQSFDASIQRVAILGKELAELQAEASSVVNTPELFQDAPGRLAEVSARVQEIQTELASLQIPDSSGLVPDVGPALGQLDELKTKADAAALAERKLGDESLAAATDIKSTAAPIAEETALLQKLESEVDDLSGKKVNVVDPKETTQASTKVTKLTKDVSGLGNAGTKAGASLKTSFAGIGQQVAGNIGQVGGLGGSILGLLGPVGLAVGAIAGIGTAFAKNTDAGEVFFDGVGRTAGNVFDKLTGTVVQFAGTITDLYDSVSLGDGVFAKTFGSLTDALFLPQRILQTIIGQVSELTGLGAALQDATKDGFQLAQAYDDIDEAQTKNIVNNAELDKQVGELNVKLRNRTTSEAERLKIGEQIGQLESQRAANELAVLSKITAAKQQEADNELKNKGEVSDATKRALAEAQAAEINAAAQSIELVERTENRTDLIRQQGEQKRAAAAAKRKAEAEKAAAEALALAEKTAAAQEKVNDVIQEASDNALTAGLSDNEKQVFAIEQRYAKEVEAAQDAFASLQELSAGNTEAQVKIAEQEAVTITDINTAKNAELQELEVKRLKELDDTRAADLDIIREATATKADLERDAINTRFDAAQAAAERTITDEEALTEALVEIAKARAEALAGVQDESQIAEQENLKKRQENATALLTSTGDQLAGLIEGVASGQIKTAEEASKALSLIALDTLEKIVTMKALEITAGTTAGGATAGGPAGAVAGLAQGLALTALIKALFAGVKGLVQANYTGDPYVGGDGSRPQFTGRDGYLRRLDEGERVVTKRTNVRNFNLFEAAEKGQEALNTHIERHYFKRENVSNKAIVDTFMQRYYTVMNTGVDDPRISDGMMVALHDGTLRSFTENNYATKVNNYMGTEEGRRNVVNPFPKFFDKNIVKSNEAARKEQKRTNDLLESIAYNLSRQAPRQHPRY